MKRLAFAILMSLIVSVISYAQRIQITKPSQAIRYDVRFDTTATRCNLRQLCNNVYVSFWMYKYGNTKAVFKYPPVREIVEGKESGRMMSEEELERIPIDSVECIKVTYNLRNQAIYGVHGSACVVEVKLRGK